jgi:hypothetical protein
LTDTSITKLFDSLWDDVSEGTPPPDKWPLLAHYTSIKNLESILRSEEIWFSHPRSMNDCSEQRFGFEKFRSIINYDRDLELSFPSVAMFSIFLTMFNGYCHLLDKGHFDNFYCFCLSEHNPNDTDGLLSMWRGYGANGSGIAIIIDPKKAPKNDKSIITFETVKYPTDIDQSKWCSSIIKKFSNIIKNNKLGKNDKEVKQLADIIFQRLRLASLHAKHTGFSEEREWRLSCHIDNKNFLNASTIDGYIIREDGIFPKLRNKIFGENQKFEDLIEMIIVGPTNASLMTKTALEIMMRDINKEFLIPKIKMSSIPFRPMKN